MMAKGTIANAFTSKKQMQADKMKDLQQPVAAAKTQAEAAQKKGA